MAHVERALTGEQAQVIPLIFWITCLSSLLALSLCVDMTSSARGGVLFVCVFYCWRRKWHPTPVLLPGKSHGWRSLVGYCPWGRKESDTTERHSLTRVYCWQHDESMTFFFLMKHLHDLSLFTDVEAHSVLCVLLGKGICLPQ